MQKVDISTSTLVRFILLLLGLGFLFLIRDVLVILFIVVIIVAGIAPTVERWQKGIGRTLAVIAVFTLIILAVSVIFSLLIPPLVTQIQEFSGNLPAYTANLSNNGTAGFFSEIARLIISNLNSLSNQLSNFSGIIFSQTLGVINGVVAAITIFVLSFYLLIDEDGVKKLYQGIIPAKYYLNLTETTRKIAGKLGAWLRGQLLVMLTVGAAVTVGMLLSGTNYALVLGLWAGLAEIVPIIGPWIGALPGVIVGLSISPVHGLIVLIIYVLIQQLESNILIPRIMSKAVGLNPVAVIIAILIGSKLYGLMGVLLAVPIAAIISVIADDWPVIQETFTRKSA